MTFIVVDRSRFRGFEGTAKKLSGDIRRTHNDLSSIGHNLDWDIRSSAGIDRMIFSINNNLEKQANAFNKLANFFVHALQEYEKLDKEELEDVQKIVNHTLPTNENKGIINDVLNWFGLDNLSPAEQILLLTNSNALVPLIIWKGLTKKASYEASLANWNLVDVKSQDGLGQATVNAKVGKVKAEWNPAKATLWEEKIDSKDKTWKAVDPKVSFGGGIELAALSVDGEGRWGTDDAALYTKGHADVLEAKAELKTEVDLKKGDVKVKASAKASVFEGEIEGGFEVLGYKIGVKAKGDALSVGAEYKMDFDVSKQQFQFGASAAALFGGGFEVSIGKK